MLEGHWFSLIVIGATVIWLAERVVRAPERWPRWTFIGIFAVYCAAVVQVTMFPIPLEGSGSAVRSLIINLLPTGDLFTPGNLAHEQAAANVLLGIPVGLLAFVVWPGISRRRVLIAGFCTFVLVEILQLLLVLVAPRSPRTTDIIDVAMNTLGVAIGIGLFMLSAHVYRLWRAQEPHIPVELEAYLDRAVAIVSDRSGAQDSDEA